MRNKLIAYSMGILCHLTFLLTIGSMGYILATGLTSGILPIGEPYGRFINFLLLIQFPILHSFFLTPMGRRILAAPFPKEIAKDLVTTTFALVASVQLLVVFVLWTPAHGVWFAPSHSLFLPWIILYGLSWVVLIKALSEAGMAMHTGALGWRSVVIGKRAIYPEIPTAGLHSQCRHPIYLAFSLIILSAPVWSLDHFLLASVWILYCLVGPRFKERRLEQWAKDEYEIIKQSTPYFVPRSFQVYSYFKRDAL